MYKNVYNIERSISITTGWGGTKETASSQLWVLQHGIMLHKYEYIYS